MGSAKPADRATRTIVLSPIATDASLSAQILSKNGIEAEVCPSVPSLVEWIVEGIGVLLVSEEALSEAVIPALAGAIERQPPWSDLPVVVLTGAEGSAASPRARRLQGIERLGNVTLLERPLRIHELVTSVRAAMRARVRQLQVRDLVKVTNEAVRARDHFLAMLGHELRNPLAAISFAMNLDRRARGDEGEKRHEATIDRQMRHLSRLVDDLLDVGRVTTGKIALKTAPLDLRGAVKRVVESLESATTHHELHVETPREVLTIDGDPVRVEQILSNILTNAFKYTPRGGRVVVRAFSDGPCAAVSVRDDGTGIEPEMLSKIFELFTQAPSTLDRSKGGLGIGLTLARNLARMHGGTIDARSEGLGRGSEFTVRFPLVDAPAARATAAPKSPRKQAARMRILLIEDNADVRDSMRELLEREGHEITTASTGSEGISRATLMSPEVAIVDIGLPDIDGFGVARALRTLKKRAIYLVALTGYGQPEDRARAEKSGFDHHLTKPVDVDVLLDVLRLAPRRGREKRR